MIEKGHHNFCILGINNNKHKMISVVREGHKKRKQLDKSFSTLRLV